MSNVLFYNLAEGTLLSPITTGALTLTLNSGQGAQFSPAPTGVQFFPLVLQSASNPTLVEITFCTNVTGDVLTIERAQEGTTALSFNAGDLAQCRPTAATLLGLQPPHGLVSFLTSTTWTVPQGVTSLEIEVWGAGGSGAGGGSGGPSGSGSGAGYSRGGFTVTPGQVLTITVGAATAGGNYNSPGINGQSSAVSPLGIVATGGYAGQVSAGQGSVGSGSGGQVNISGSVGIGGASVFGAPGGSAYGATGAPLSNAAGNGGQFPGGGGGGAYGIVGGGAGAAGYVIISW